MDGKLGRGQGHGSQTSGWLREKKVPSGEKGGYRIWKKSGSGWEKVRKKQRFNGDVKHIQGGYLGRGGRNPSVEVDGSLRQKKTKKKKKGTTGDRARR